MSTKLLVIGGDAAGLSGASRARRNNPEMKITVLEKGEFASYAACGMPYYLSGVVPDYNSLIARKPEVFKSQNIDIRLGNEALELDPNTQSVKVIDTVDRGEYVEHYDKLIIATGARPVTPPIPGVDAKGIFTLRHLDDARLIHSFTSAKHANAGTGHATVVGAGYVGMEMVETLKTLGYRVTLVEMAPQVFPGLDPILADIVEKECINNGITVMLEEQVDHFDKNSDEYVNKIYTSNSSWDTDLVLLSTGVRPNVELAVQGGLSLDTAGAIKTDKFMSTSHPNIWSAGDCTSAKHLVTKQPTWIPLGTTANKQGRIAGENASGGNVAFKGVLGTAVVKVFNLEVAKTGLSEKEAADAGYNTSTITITASDKAHYYPGNADIHIQLIAENKGGRLLGGQFVGGQGSAKRIDTIATAITCHMNIRELSELDLSYAPPIAPVWDPVLIAAEQLAKKIQ
ncbi:MAG: FAD-dependent oxidoreductase [Actinobacteria bacterium]|nr:FAD-dependent oxidoreductase [Actinomycetota bacterium]MCL6105048.1 FAD-dependent oxidoreductase [Actinomycetota bacterium]